MMVISLWDPWATLLAYGKKRIETRGWSTDYRGLVAIHATKGGIPKRQMKALCTLDQSFSVALSSIFLRDAAAGFHPGHLLAVGTLADCLPTVSVGCLPGVFDDYPKLKTPQEIDFGNYAAGRFGFVFHDVQVLRSPIPFKSRQGKLLKLDPAAEADVLSQVLRGAL